jgi:(1->4)-alpha-D-glucan 1-alpha-D-glucosylmutase
MSTEQPESLPAASIGDDLDARAQRLVAALAEALRREPLQRPTATYRLQLTNAFTFDHATRLVPYLAALGISDVYLSPILQAAPGSTHGYDVVDHGTLNSELGGPEAYARLCQALREKGLGQIIDFVPNHMGIGPQNPWWVDVLENGPSSRYAPYFDIDWKPVKSELEHKVLVPILGDQYGVTLEKGELKLSRKGGAFILAYWDNHFPVAPGRIAQLLKYGHEALSEELGGSDPDLQELESIINQLEKLPSRNETEAPKVAERAREKEIAKRRLAALCEASPRIRAFIDGNVQRFNGTPGEPRSFDLLDSLLDNQAYRLAYWRTAGEEINYRRFFDINSLAAIRMEDDRVFQDSHRLVMALLAEGTLTGLRIDHPDGLYDPDTYFRNLQVSYLVGRCRQMALDDGAARPGHWELEPYVRDAVEQALDAGELPAEPVYVVAEKILSRREPLRASWSVAGTTGYDFLAQTTGLFVDPAAEKAMGETYEKFVGVPKDFPAITYARKKLIMSSSMASEINMLASRLNRISETNRRTRDFTLNELTRAITEFIACFPVYRTYIRGPDAQSVDARDRQQIEQTIARAKRKSRTTNASIYEFLRDVMLLRYPETLSTAERAMWLEFALKLQQVTGPVTAKAVEDTAFYNYHRLIALNEVGGEPRSFGTTLPEFNAACAERQAHYPHTLNATSTHDTKRSEDVRARIAALSEVPQEWSAHVAHWALLNASHKTEVEERPAPDADDEYLLYQTLLGACPPEEPGSEAWTRFVQRVCAYMEKAQREAKVHTSWTNPNPEYEAATKKFVEGMLHARPFLEAFLPFARRLSRAGAFSSLSQTALKCFAPGVPDVYQGCELTDLSLVDPDNRRAVDYERRIQLLATFDQARGDPARLELARSLCSEEAMGDGRAKLLLLARALRFRKEHPALFQQGEFEPLTATGRDAQHVVAFARWHGQESAVLVAPRWLLDRLDGDPLEMDWQAQLQLPEGQGGFTNLLTGERVDGGEVELRDLWASFPVALLGHGSRQ